MSAFEPFSAVAMPLLRDNIDTDAIIPSREMKTVSKSGLADGLFAGWRYSDAARRTPDPAFILNDARYVGAQILLTGANFGCGSSREHAVWALKEYGFRAVLASSFNPIFRNNCVANGVAPILLEADEITALASFVAADPQGRRLDLDLAAGGIAGGPTALSFSLDEEARETLLSGLDPINRTLREQPRIAAFIKQDRMVRPWVY